MIRTKIKAYETAIITARIAAVIEWGYAIKVIKQYYYR